MKTKLIALALVLVIAAVAIVCVSCAKKEKEYPAELISFSVVNKTGESITSLVMDDTRMVSRMETKPLGGGWEDGESISFSMTAAMENNAPDLQLTITTGTGFSIVPGFHTCFFISAISPPACIIFFIIPWNYLHL